MRRVLASEGRDLMDSVLEDVSQSKLSFETLGPTWLSSPKLS